MRWYDTIPYQFSRGCPFDCEFRDIVQLFGRKPRTKSPAQFILEIAAVVDVAISVILGIALTVYVLVFVGSNLRPVRWILRIR
jgi:hypothetical protein